jgi:NAD-dependent dihydropyrimidine dehydrogenase PreA subunit
MVNAEVLVWGVSVAVVAAIVLPYVLSFRRRRHSDRSRKEEAVRLGVDRPQAQFPFVDPMRCIGCGACVDACPEGDVLGIVGGTATVVNGLRCVGHGRCEIACPVGAIEVGLGDLKSRKDIPVLDEWQQTSVPGVFVAGELGGLALVKNAIAQARRW